MIKETFKQAVQNVLSNKVRTFLTMLGIIIGVMAVIVIVGLGNGMTHMMQDFYSDMGSDILAAHPRFLLPQPPLPASLSLLPAFCRHSWISRFPVFSSYPAVYRPSQRPSFRFGSTDNYHTSGKSLLIFGEIGIFFSRFCICRKSLFFVYSGAAFALFGYRFSGANL